MAFKQTTFDFDLPPEPGKPEGTSLPGRAVEDVENVKRVEEAERGEVIEAIDEIPTVDDTIREVEFIVSEPVKPLDAATVKKSSRGRMKLTDMNTGADLIDVPEDDVLFQKSYYSIGTVSEMFKVNISLIRFWENEFDILKPKKNGKGDRLFRPEDVKNLKMIYHLLRERKYTIEGARDFLKKNNKAEANFEMIESLRKMKAFLLELKANF